jgi:hypothetical protein
MSTAKPQSAPDPEQFPNPKPPAPKSAPQSPPTPGSGPEGNPTPVGPEDEDDAASQGPLTSHPARPANAPAPSPGEAD